MIECQMPLNVSAFDLQHMSISLADLINWWIELRVLLLGFRLKFL